MFVETHELVRDLDSYSTDGTDFAAAWRPANDQVGAALVAFATGRVPKPLAASYGETVAANHQTAARRFIASHFFAPGASHYCVLGALPASSSEQLRKNYRRLMALVHPDAMPVGFPLDAAARVNRAYAVLTDPTARQKYDEALAPEPSGIAPRRPTSGASARPNPEVPESSANEGWTARLRQKMPTLGFRKGLIAATLASCAGVALLWSALMPSAPVATLVVSRPKLAIAEELGPPTSPPQAIPPTREAVVSPDLPPSAVDAPRAPLRLATHLDTSRVAKATERLAIVASAPPNNSTEPIIRAVPEPSVANVYAAQPTPIPPEIVASKPTIERAAPRTSESPDIDQVIAQFASAFETGSTSLLGATLSTTMPSRENVLAEYERVFRQTKQRSIRFANVKHTAMADNRLISSGVATVTTTDLSDRSSRQRVFLEIEIAREASGSRIIRLANYEQK